MVKDKNKFKISIFLLVLSMIFVSCSTNSKTEKKEYENKLSDSNAEEPITFKIFSADINLSWDYGESPVAEEIRKKTGVTLEYEFAQNDVEEKISLMAASGEYPDMIYAKGDTPKLISANALVKLDELIEKYGTNIKKLYGKYFKRLRYSKDDKSIYNLGAFSVGDELYDTSSLFWIQHSVVLDQKFPELITLYDFEEAIIKYKEKYPTIDGKPTIGLSLIADDWRFLISVTNPAAAASGKPDDGEWYIDPETNKATLHYTRNEEKEYFKWLNHINDIGLLDPDSFTQKYDQYIKKVSTGRIIALIDANWDLEEAQRNLKSNNKEERMYGSYPITIDKTMKYASTQSAGYSGGWGIGITKNCKDIDRAVQFLDYICSDEGQILTNWGTEGTLYNVVNGKRELIPEAVERMKTDNKFVKETGIGNYNYPLPQYGIGRKDSTGQYYLPEFKEGALQNYTETEKKVLAGYNSEMWIDLFPKTDEFIERPWGAAWQISISDIGINKKLEECKEITNKMIPEIIVSNPDDFDNLWNKYIKELENAGKEDLEKAFTKLIKDRVELWND